MDKQSLDGPSEQRVNEYPGLVWPSLESINESCKLLPSSKSEWKEAYFLIGGMTVAAVAFVAIVAELLL